MEKELNFKAFRAVNDKELDGKNLCGAVTLRKCLSSFH